MEQVIYSQASCKLLILLPQSLEGWDLPFKKQLLKEWWWCMPTILALERQRQEDQELKANLGYMSPCITTPPYQQTKQNSSHYTK